MNGIDLVNHGQVTLGADASFDTVNMVNGATLENTGALSLADGSILKDDNGVGSGNKLVNDAGGTITYPGGSNGATLDVDVTNSGTITAASGTLSLGGSYASTGSPILSIGISGSKTFGHLSIAGTATLAGTLALQTSSGYKPSIGTTLAILTAGKRIGTFSQVTGTQLSGEHWSVTYSSTRVTVKAVSG